MAWLCGSRFSASHWLPCPMSCHGCLVHQGPPHALLPPDLPQALSWCLLLPACPLVGSGLSMVRRMELSHAVRNSIPSCEGEGLEAGTSKQVDDLTSSIRGKSLPTPRWMPRTLHPRILGTMYKSQIRGRAWISEHHLTSLESIAMTGAVS
jgi:hypothetical protein